MVSQYCEDLGVCKIYGGSDENTFSRPRISLTVVCCIPWMVSAIRRLNGPIHGGRHIKGQHELSQDPSMHPITNFPPPMVTTIPTEEELLEMKGPMINALDRLCV